MRAAVAQQYGGVEVLQLKTDFQRPVISSTQVLVRIHAAAANSADALLRSGKVKLVIHTSLPFIPGLDASGVVESIGTKVTRFKVGDEVYGFNKLNRGGTYAEYCAFEESYLAHKPNNLTYQQAASVPTAILTSQRALVDVGQVSKGQRLLVIGASGGVGSHVVQYAKALGLFVIGVCSSRNVDWVKEHTGADIVIDYTQNKYNDILSTEDDKVDIVVDAVGDSSSTDQAYTVLKKGGKFVSCVSFNYLKAFTSSLGVCRPFSIIGSTVPNGPLLEQLSQYYVDNKLVPLVTEVTPLSEAQEIHRKLESGRTRGKIVIEIDQ